MQRLAFLVSLLLSITGTNATTFYVDNSCPVNGNGLTKHCGENGPWNSLKKAAECKDVNPGDTIEIRAGKGVYNEGWSWQPKCIGTPEKHITIQNYPLEDFVMEGTLNIKNSAWRAIGNGIYLCEGGTCGTEKKFPFTAWYDRGNGEERLDLIQSNQTCDTSLPAGQMRYSDGRVCAHLSDDSNPADAKYFKIPYVYVAIQLNLVRASYVTFRKNPKGGNFIIRRFRDSGITTTTIDRGIDYEGLDIGWVMDRCIDQTEGGVVPAGYRFINNRIHHCGQEGIRWSQDSSPRGLVEGNEVYEIQTQPFFERCKKNCLPGFNDKGCAIRVAGNQNGRIRRNIVHDIGGGLTGRSSGIDLEEGAINTVVENNYLYRMNKGDIPAWHTSIAILLQTVGAEPYNAIVRNNHVYQSDHCFSIDAGKTLPESSTILFSHNTCQDPRDSGIVTGMSNPTINAKITSTNNIFSADETSPRALIDLPNDRRISGFQTPENNIFQCVQCTKLVNWGRKSFKACNIKKLGHGNQLAQSGPMSEEECP
ncbi:MAG: right-handed parallel beta-helix repeat-containing protein [Pseudomonadota bacterium]